MLSKEFKNWAEDTSKKMRAQLCLNPEDFMCAFTLSKLLAVPVVAPSMINKLPESDLNHLVADGAAHWSAARIIIGDGQDLILYNPTHNEVRQQSDIMHEIAHILCKHVPGNSHNIYNLPTLLRSYDAGQEAEAEWLGSCLQLPKPALKWAVKNNLTTDEISTKYQSSKAMVNYRLNITGAKKYKV